MTVETTFCRAIQLPPSQLGCLRLLKWSLLSKLTNSVKLGCTDGRICTLYKAKHIMSLAPFAGRTGLKLDEGHQCHGLWCPSDWPKCPSQKSQFGLRHFFSLLSILLFLGKLYYHSFYSSLLIFQMVPPTDPHPPSITPPVD